MSNKVTADQRKCFNVLLHAAREILEREPDTQLFQADLATVKKLAGISANNNQQIKKSLKELVNITIEYNLLNKDKKNEWGAFSLLAQAKIIDGTGLLSFQFPLDIHNTLLRPDMYVLLDLSIIKGLQSKYSIALYEVLKDYKNMGTIKIEMAYFIDLMGLEKVYNDFANIRRRVLKPAITEINDKTDITVDCKEITEGRKIVELIFNIGLNEPRINPKTILLKPSNSQLEKENTIAVDEEKKTRKVRPIDNIDQGLYDYILEKLKKDKSKRDPRAIINSLSSAAIESYKKELENKLKPPTPNKTPKNELDKKWEIEYAKLTKNIDTETEALWKNVCSNLSLSGKIKEISFVFYFTDLKLVSCADARADLVCKSFERAAHIKSRYKSMIEESFLEVTNKKYKVTIEPTKAKGI